MKRYKESDKGIFPDINSKEFKNLQQRIIKLDTEFKDLKEDLINLYDNLGITRFDQLGGRRQPTIIKKLYKFKGDITPPMLVSLIKDIKEG